ncbi:chemotaxis protein CheY [Pseudomonas sp. Fl4BN1]|uniref:chemotaxis protein CheY n=1 Tax=Pseudomonas sp. Fl4BN1 TaxID=2697651 RepID=UPI001376D528|nr:chemotaxis protein CheY [Pseudomonas sp. Fl4BN1]NBF11483.1 chemotaxis protein CheY [Pseudomonas sp. Fl4BN1]
MTNKTLRILVADDQHFQRLKIEKILNQLGYFRIAPVQSFDEIEILTCLASRPFDLLIISTTLVAERKIDLDAFCRDNPLIHHALIYDNQQAQLPPMPQPLPPAVQISLPGAPGSESLRQLMAIIDPPVQRPGLQVLPWLRELSRGLRS